MTGNEYAHWVALAELRMTESEQAREKTKASRPTRTRTFSRRR